MDIDAFLKECFLKKCKVKKTIIVAPTYRTFFQYPNRICCSKALAELWKQHFFVITSPYVAFTFNILRYANKFLNIEVNHYSERYNTHCEVFPINYKYKGPPQVVLSKKLLEDGYNTLNKLGIPRDSKFVVFVNRDSGYRNCSSYFSYRNNDVNLYRKALEEIVNNGYYCIRIGSENSQPLKRNGFSKIQSYVIDYTRSSFRTDWMDLFLVDKAKFVLSGSSGIIGLPLLFQTPLIIASLCPFAHFAMRKQDLNILKLYRSKKDNRLLNFSEILSSKIKYFIFDNEFKANELELEEPTEDDILEGVKEMIVSIKSNNFEKSEIQKRFDSVCRVNCYSYPPPSRISEAFLKKYEFLLK
jgi:putative glycosyltransferase (TIGR04372 family)